MLCRMLSINVGPDQPLILDATQPRILQPTLSCCNLLALSPLQGDTQRTMYYRVGAIKSALTASSTRVNPTSWHQYYDLQTWLKPRDSSHTEMTL